MSILVKKIETKAGVASVADILNAIYEVTEDENITDYTTDPYEDDAWELTDVNGFMVRGRKCEPGVAGTEAISIIFGDLIDELFIPCFDEDNESFKDKVYRSLIAFESASNTELSCPDKDFNFLKNIWGFKEGAEDRVMSVMFKALGFGAVEDED